MRVDKVLYLRWQREKVTENLVRGWAAYCYGVHLRTGRYPWNAT